MTKDEQRTKPAADALAEREKAPPPCAEKAAALSPASAGKSSRSGRNARSNKSAAQTQGLQGPAAPVEDLTPAALDAARAALGIAAHQVLLGAAVNGQLTIITTDGRRFRAPLPEA